MERQAIAYLCIDIHDFNDEFLLEYAEIGEPAIQIAKERLNFKKQIEEIEGMFHVFKNKEATKIISKFRKYVGEIQTILRVKGLDVTSIHNTYKNKMEKLEISANLLFDKISEQEHQPDIFDDNSPVGDINSGFDIELQPIRGRNKKYQLPPIVNAPKIEKLSKWKQWRQNRKSMTKNPNVSKKGYGVLVEL